MMTSDLEGNAIIDLDSVVVESTSGWVSRNTAILIVHGIGNQLPLETLDQFGRGLVKQFTGKYGHQLTLNHELMSKPGSSGEVWFDNVLRIKKEDSEHYIDLYEYYWANYTEDKASWKDINTWLQGIVSGARKFYKRNGQFGSAYKDTSIFFDKKGNFKTGTYRLFLTVASKLFIFIDVVIRGLLWLVAKIPFVGKFAESMFRDYSESFIHSLSNVIGDIVVYNAADPKSKFYDIRRRILDGAVKSVKFLLEKQENEHIDLVALKHEYALKKQGLPIEERKKLEDEMKAKMKGEKLFYPSVIIAGHSLGTQVSYDAINKLNLLVNKGEVATYATDGTCLMQDNIKLSQQLNGYITFGSPLDKIVFFLRENVPDDQYIRQQFLDNYHGFKQRDLNSRFNAASNKQYMKADCDLQRLLEEVKWRNYFDGKDYVSGGLDYYTNLTNVDCKFTAGKLGFTHSYYWDSEPFFADIVINYLSR